MSFFSLDKVTELIKLAPRYLFALVIAGILMIVLPERAMSRLGLRDTWTHPQFWIGIIILLAASLLLAHGLAKVWGTMLGRYSTRKDRKRREQKFSNLTVPERKLLQCFVSAGSRSQQLKYDDGVVIGLMRDGMLSYASDRAVSYFDPQNFYTQVNMEHWAWEFLQQHPECLSVDDADTSAEA